MNVNVALKSQSSTLESTSESTSTPESKSQSDDDDDLNLNFGIKTYIYDSRPSLNFEAGAGVQINGGARTLQKINDNLYRKVVGAALPLKTIRSRTKPWFGNGNGDYATLLELNLEEIIKQTGGDVEEELIVDGEVMAYTIMRGALQVSSSTLHVDKMSNIYIHVRSCAFLCLTLSQLFSITLRQCQ